MNIEYLPQSYTYKDNLIQIINNIFSDNTDLITLKNIIDIEIAENLFDKPFFPKYQSHANMHIKYSNHEVFKNLIDSVLKIIKEYVGENFIIWKTWFLITKCDTYSIFHRHIQSTLKNMICVFYVYKYDPEHPDEILYDIDPSQMIPKYPVKYIASSGIEVTEEIYQADPSNHYCAMYVPYVKLACDCCNS